MAAKEGALRTIGHSVSKKEPSTVDMLKSIVYLFGHEKSNLKDVRTAYMCLLSFSGLLRFAELSNIKRDNITFYDDYIKVVIKQSKTVKKLRRTEGGAKIVGVFRVNNICSNFRGGRLDPPLGLMFC